MHISAAVSAASAGAQARRSGLPRSSDVPPAVAKKPSVPAPPLRLRFVLVLGLVALAMWSEHRRRCSPRSAASRRDGRHRRLRFVHGRADRANVDPRPEERLRTARAAALDRVRARRATLSSLRQAPAPSVINVDLERIRQPDRRDLREYSGHGTPLAELGVSGVFNAQPVWRFLAVRAWRVHAG